MPAISVSKSITIDETAGNIFSKLNDFNHWTAWSPWLIMEPEASVTVSDDAKYYHWEGERVGEGEMKIISEKENEKVDYDLTFLKPWKSHAKVTFILESAGDSTKVTWTMDSSLPWFMFWMKASMEGFIGMDFERGLNMLKDYIEKGSVPSKLEYIGEFDFEGTTFVGLKSTCPFADIGPTMQEDFGKLGEYAMSNHENTTGMMFSQYHDWDIKNQTTTYSVAFGVKEVPSDLPDGFYIGEIPQTKMYRTRHTGPYNHLGNAWSAMMNLGRSKVFKQNKKIDPIEIYVSDPQEIPENELVTDICFPVK
jgi:effector-binding domain-containing protein